MSIIGHGIDIVEVARIDRMLADHADRFVERCFTPAEQGYAESAAQSKGERYAARFAAKEAVLKALGTGWRGGIAWTDIEVRRDPMGRPSITLTGRCAEIAAEQGIDRWLLSLSHAAGLATASAIAVGPG